MAALHDSRLKRLLEIEELVSDGASGKSSARQSGTTSAPFSARSGWFSPRLCGTPSSLGGAARRRPYSARMTPRPPSAPRSTSSASTGFRGSLTYSGASTRSSGTTARRPRSATAGYAAAGPKRWPSGPSSETYSDPGAATGSRLRPAEEVRLRTTLEDMCSIISAKAYQRFRSSHECFRFLDEDKDGLVTRDELVHFAERLGFNTGVGSHIFDMLAQLDGAQRGGGVRVDVFMDSLAPFMGHRPTATPRGNSKAALDFAARRDSLASSSPRPNSAGSSWSGKTPRPASARAAYTRPSSSGGSSIGTMSSRPSSASGVYTRKVGGPYPFPPTLQKPEFTRASFVGYGSMRPKPRLEARVPRSTTSTASDASTPLSSFGGRSEDGVLLNALAGSDAGDSRGGSSSATSEYSIPQEHQMREDFNLPWPRHGPSYAVLSPTRLDKRELRRLNALRGRTCPPRRIVRSRSWHGPLVVTAPNVPESTQERAGPNRPQTPIVGVRSPYPYMPEPPYAPVEFYKTKAEWRRCQPNSFDRITPRGVADTAPLRERSDVPGPQRDVQAAGSRPTRTRSAGPTMRTSADGRARGHVRGTGQSYTTHTGRYNYEVSGATGATVAESIATPDAAGAPWTRWDRP
mmetsp:Transcript_82413/g.229623  ORF Transcript_82413/g.229623 Transcript_82413/m.229623 type:complete len:632 (-) Transcript_82413:43-1938(-)